MITGQDSESFSLFEVLQTNGTGLAGFSALAILPLGQLADPPSRQTTGTPLDGCRTTLRKMAAKQGEREEQVIKGFGEKGERNDRENGEDLHRLNSRI